MLTGAARSTSGKSADLDRALPCACDRETIQRCIHPVPGDAFFLSGVFGLPGPQSAPRVGQALLLLEGFALQALPLPGSIGFNARAGEAPDVARDPRALRCDEVGLGAFPRQGQGISLERRPRPSFSR